MLLRSDRCLDSVRMTGKQHGINRFHRFGIILREAHVLLLIDGLQLGVETPDDGMDEPVGLNLRPILYLIGRDIFLIDSHIIGSKGIGACRSDDGHKLVIFIGNSDLGSFVADRVDHMVEGNPLSGIGLCPVDFEQTADLIKHRLLSLVV